MQHKHILFLVCVICSFVFLWPQLVLPLPNFLDIAETWSLRTNIFENVLFDFQNSERFRPLYVAHHTVMNLIFDYQPQWYFVGFALLLGATAYLLIENNRRIHWVDGFILLLVYISPVTIDTYWRLGTAENLFALILIAMLRFCIAHRYTGLVILAVMLMLSKETAIFYAPLIIGYLLVYKRKVEGALLSVIYLGYIGKLLPLVQFAASHEFSYTSLFSISLRSIGDMVIYYLQLHAFYVCIYFFAIGIFVYNAFIQKKYKKSISNVDSDVIPMIFALAGFLSIVFFHNNNQPYYFFPTYVTILFVLKYQLDKLSDSAKLLSVIYVLSIGVLAGIGHIASDRALYWQNDYIGDNMLLEQIYAHKKTRVYEFDRIYRPELSDALKYIYGDTGITGSGVNVYKIISVRNQNQDSVGIETLCGKSFGLYVHCKWGVHTTN